MSFEGYFQFICENWHYFEGPYDYAGDVPEENCLCPHCKSTLQWSNLVDVTNGSFDTDPVSGKEVRIDGFVKLVVDKPAQTCNCPTCGNIHATSPTTYKVPTDEGKRLE